MQVNIIEVKTKIKNVNTYNVSSLFINLQDTMNRIEIVISSTKTTDMKTIREIVAEYIPNKDISAEMVDKLYEYKNQRVIEELEKIKELNVDIPVFGGGTTISAVTVENIDREIRILKQ